MINKKIYFTTFADSRLQPTLKRIVSEAKDSNFFDGIFPFNEFSLGREFERKFGHRINYKTRGYGYWVWKPTIIIDALSKIKEGEFLLYTDAGCSFNKKGFKKLQEYTTLAEGSDLGILAVVLEDNKLEKMFTKGDLFNFLEVREEPMVYNTPQIQSGLILIRKSEKSKQFLKEWQDVYLADRNLVNDSPSKSPNFPDFIEHRHDQSVFSILMKIYKGTTIPLQEVWVKNIQDTSSLQNSPIWYLRQKNRKISGLKYLIINRVRYALNMNKGIQ